MTRRVEIHLRNKLMVEWAIQCINSQQILWRGGYPQVMVSLYHYGNGGTCATLEVKRHES